MKLFRVQLVSLPALATTVLAAAVLVAGEAAAQVKPPVKKDPPAAQKPPIEKKAGKPPEITKEVKPGAAKPQDKDEEPPAAPAIDTTKLLENARDNAQREQRYLQKVLDDGGLVRRFREIRAETGALIRKFMPPTSGPTLPKKTASKARLLGDGEKETLGNDVVFTVESVPVTQSEYDGMLAYLRSYPRADSSEDVQAAAILSLVQAKAPQSIYAESTKQARAAIEELAKEIRAGKNFSELAKAHSDDAASAENGGKLGEIVRATADKNYAQAAFSLQPGKVSPVVATGRGFHLIMVLAKKKGTTTDQDRVRTKHILKRYVADAKQVNAMLARVKTGSIDLAFRTDDLRKFAPAQFK